MIVVSDTSPIRALWHLGLMTLLRDLFGEVFVPPAVVAELSDSPSRLPAISVEGFDFLRIQAPRDRSRVMQLASTLDAGESEALALAVEIGAGAVLIDERAGRARALKLGLQPLGLLGILARAKANGQIQAIGPLVRTLQGETAFFVSDALLREVLREAGE